MNRPASATVRRTAILSLIAIAAACAMVAPRLSAATLRVETEEEVIVLLSLSVQAKGYAVRVRASKSPDAALRLVNTALASQAGALCPGRIIAADGDMGIQLFFPFIECFEAIAPGTPLRLVALVEVSRRGSPLSLERRRISIAVPRAPPPGIRGSGSRLGCSLPQRVLADDENATNRLIVRCSSSSSGEPYPG